MTAQPSYYNVHDSVLEFNKWVCKPWLCVFVCVYMLLISCCLYSVCFQAYEQSNRIVQCTTRSRQTNNESIHNMYRTPMKYTHSTQAVGHDKIHKRIKMYNSSRPLMVLFISCAPLFRIYCLDSGNLRSMKWLLRHWGVFVQSDMNKKSSALWAQIVFIDGFFLGIVLKYANLLEQNDQL